MIIDYINVFGEDDSVEDNINEDNDFPPDLNWD